MQNIFSVAGQDQTCPWGLQTATSKLVPKMFAESKIVFFCNYKVAQYYQWIS